MRVAAVQHDIVFERTAETLDSLEPLVVDAAESGAQLVVLPEMFSTGFTMRAREPAEAEDGPSVTFLAERAARHGCWLAGSVPTRSSSTPDAPRITNRLHVLGPAGEHHRYDKLHPFSLAREQEHYAAGDTTLTLDIGGCRISWFVCYDLRFANAFWALAPDTDAYVVVANWPDRRRAHWDALLRARAIENQAHVVGVNRVGSATGVAHSGGTVILDPGGDAIAGVLDNQVGVAVADIEREAVTRARARFGFLDDRRTDV